MFKPGLHNWEIQGYQGFDGFLTVPYFKAGLQWYQTQWESLSQPWSIVIKWKQHSLSTNNSVTNAMMNTRLIEWQAEAEQLSK